MKRKYILLPILALSLVVGCERKNDDTELSDTNNDYEAAEQIEITETEKEVKAEEFFDAARNIDTSKMDEMTNNKYDFYKIDNLGEQEKILIENIFSRSEVELIDKNESGDTAILSYELTSLDIQDLTNKAISSNLENLFTSGRNAKLNFENINYDEVQKDTYDVSMTLEKTYDSWTITEFSSPELEEALNILK